MKIATVNLLEPSLIIQRLNFSIIVKSLGGSLDTSPEASIRVRAVVRALSDLEESMERTLPTSDLMKYAGSLEFILTSDQ